MRKSLLLALLLALGCQKSSPPPVAQVEPAGPRVGKAAPSRKSPPRSKRLPLAERGDRSMIPVPLPPPPAPKPKLTVNKDEVIAAVHSFLTTTGATTAAVGNSSEAQQERAQNVGGGYNNVQVTAVGDPKEYPQVAETKKPGWVVAVSFTANNPRLKCRLRATNHLFLVSRASATDPPRVFYHGSSESLAKARLGDEWFILNRPPRPESETNP